MAFIRNTTECAMARQAEEVVVPFRCRDHMGSVDSPGAFGVLVAIIGLIIAYDAGAELEHQVIVGLGGAVEVELPGRRTHGGGNLFLEVLVVENWLEMELGVSTLGADGGVEVPMVLLVKKPFHLHRRVELMVGLGPALVAYSGTPKDGAFFGFDVVADFMFWPSHSVGFWVEPSYDLVLRSGVAHSLGWTGGVLFGW